MGFRSYRKQIDAMLKGIVADKRQHGRWLNTLSYLENCGARQMAACEHPTMVPEEMLKHASEEFRHAHYLKAQIAKVCGEPLENYRIDKLLGRYASLHYLRALDLRICRLLKQNYGLKGGALRAAAYAVTSYAIERRAEELYPAYQAELKATNQPLSISNIIKEEEHHLEEMIELLDKMENGWEMAEQACAIESDLCEAWLHQMAG